MAVRPLYALAEQVLGWRSDTMKLHITQRWTGFPDGQQLFVVSINDELTAKRLGPAEQIVREFGCSAAHLRPHEVTEDQARDYLERMSRPRERQCDAPRCNARMPLGAAFCLRCGTPGRSRKVTVVDGKKVVTPPFKRAPERVTATG